MKTNITNLAKDLVSEQPTISSETKWENYRKEYLKSVTSPARKEDKIG